MTEFKRKQQRSHHTQSNGSASVTNALVYRYKSNAKIVVSRRIPGPEKATTEWCIEARGEKGGRKGGKGKKTLEQCGGNIKISKGGGKKLSLQNLVQKV